MTNQLPDAPWRSHAGLARVVAALSTDSGVVRYVGGAVRDTLLGRAVEDVDLATPLPPAEVVRRLETAGIKAVPTGIAHGTITALADGHRYEVTTLRRDVATDGRRATVAFASDWREDAARRDFTINALYVDPETAEIFDYFGGIADLAAGRVRFIGDAGQRIDEDHLRILRYFRFLARFGDGQADAATLAIIADRAPKLRSLSRERIADELTKLLGVSDPSDVVDCMIGARIFDHIAPEIDAAAPARLRTLIAAERAAGRAPDPTLRLIALLPPDAAVADAVAARLKLSIRLRRRLARARSADWQGLSPRPLAYRIGVEAALDRALLAGDATTALIDLSGWQPPRLPIGGGDILALGVPAGPHVAQLLRAIEDQWLAEGFPDLSRTRAIATASVQQAMRQR